MGLPHLNHVLPPLPVRQWVLSLPKRIRPFLPHDPRLAGDILRILLRASRTTLRRASPGATADAQLGAVTFHEATHLSDDDIHRLERTLQRRVLRLFQRRGLLDDLAVTDMLTWQASGGFSLDASVRIHGSDSAGRERLLRYCARPPFALERIRVVRHVEERPGSLLNAHENRCARGTLRGPLPHQRRSIKDRSRRRPELRAPSVLPCDRRTTRK